MTNNLFQRLFDVVEEFVDADEGGRFKEGGGEFRQFARHTRLYGPLNLSHVAENFGQSHVCGGVKTAVRGVADDVHLGAAGRF